MYNLHPNWITEGTIDFEYKKYLLLAYLRDIEKYFKDEKLYPPLAELVGHHRNLVQLKYNLLQTKEKFPKELTNVDLQRQTLLYNSLIADDKIINEIEHIIGYALPQMETQLKNGAEIYEDVDHSLQVFAVGVLPLQFESGYFMIGDVGQKNIQLFNYEFTLFEHTDAKYRGIKTTWLNEFKMSITTNYESIKYDLIKQVKNLQTIATFVIEVNHPFPFTETLLPVAKRKLVRYISEL